MRVANDKKLLSGKRVGIDSTTLEANAAMKSIVRKKSGETYKKYLRRLAEESGVEDPDDEDLRRFDRKRPGKASSNDEWKSPTDPDSRISRMKDGRTRLSYKAEHAVDLDSDIVVSAEIYHGNDMDTSTLIETVERASANLYISGAGRRMTDVIADKGYHSTSNLLELEESGLRPGIPERRGRRRWKSRTAAEKDAVYANRRRLKTKTGRKLQRLRSEFTERSFAHVCNQGGARRTWIRGVTEIAKRYAMTVAARNLSVIMRKLFGVGSPRDVKARSVTECGLVASLQQVLVIVRVILLRVESTVQAI